MRTGTTHYYIHFKRFPPAPAILEFFSKTYIGKKKGRLPSSYLHFLMSLGQQTENGADFNNQGETGGKEVITGAQKIISAAS